MKRKKAGRKTRKTPALPAKPLLLPGKGGRRLPPFWSEAGEYPRFTPAEGTPCWTAGTNIQGITVPPDIEKAIIAHGNETWSWIFAIIENEPWRFFDHFPNDAGDRFTTFGDIDLGDPASWIRNDLGGWNDHLDFSYAELMVLHAAINTAMAQGFFLALLRYADDLKHVPEAAALLEAKRRGSQKGAAARRKQAEPTRKAVCKRFREMRKTTPKKTVRYLRVAEEFGMSDRHVQRIVNEAGID